MPWNIPSSRGWPVSPDWNRFFPCRASQSVLRLLHHQPGQPPLVCRMVRSFLPDPRAYPGFSLPGQFRGWPRPRPLNPALIGVAPLSYHPPIPPSSPLSHFFCPFRPSRLLHPTSPASPPPNFSHPCFASPSLLPHVKVPRWSRFPTQKNHSDDQLLHRAIVSHLWHTVFPMVLAHLPRNAPRMTGIMCQAPTRRLHTNSRPRAYSPPSHVRSPHVHAPQSPPPVAPPSSPGDPVQSSAPAPPNPQRAGPLGYTHRAGGLNPPAPCPARGGKDPRWSPSLGPALGAGPGRGAGRGGAKGWGE